MSKRGPIRYLLALGLAIVLALAYIAHRDLFGRYEEYQQGEAAVEAAQKKSQDLEEELRQLDERVKALNQNSLEMEAAIRRIKRLVRDGETVYRLEEAPETAAPAPDQPGSGDGRANKE